MSNLFKEYPGDKVYIDAAGHQRVASPQQSSHDNSWFYVWSWASCTDTCPRCQPSEQDDYAGERWDDE